MAFSLPQWIIGKISIWLLHQDPPQREYLCDFNIICSKIRPTDILMVDGRSRISKMIKLVTQSPWSHAALYIGRLQDIKDPQMQARIRQYYSGSPEKQLLIESEIGKGTIITTVDDYKNDHLRIVRPEWLLKEDVNKVISYALGRLGVKYSIRHLLDLARFIFPWSIFPRKWRSSLFQHNALQPTEDICSSMIADAFQSVHYPILPLIQEGSEKQLIMTLRNSRLYTPSDFDYSPYFSIIKYPIFPPRKIRSYANLPWVDADPKKEGLESD